MDLLVCLFAGSLLAVHGAYYGAISHACLVIGKNLEGVPEGSSGFQDAITPPIATRSIMANWLLSLGLLGAALYYYGWLGFGVALLSRIAISTVITIRLTKGLPHPHFVRVVFRSMSVREADYVKNGDRLRAEAMSDLIARFSRSSFVRFL